MSTRVLKTGIGTLGGNLKLGCVHGEHEAPNGYSPGAGVRASDARSKSEAGLMMLGLRAKPQ